MGNFADKLRGVSIANNQLLIDELTSTNEVMLRIPIKAIERIEQASDCIFVLTVFTDMLLELGSRQSRSYGRFASEIKDDRRLDVQRQVSKLDLERMMAKITRAEQLNPGLDSKTLTQHINEEEARQLRENKQTRESGIDFTRQSKNQLIPKRPIQTALISSDEEEAQTHYREGPIRGTQKEKVLPKMRKDHESVDEKKSLFRESTSRVNNDATQNFEPRQTFKDQRNAALKPTDTSSNSLVDIGHRLGQRYERGGLPQDKGQSKAQVSLFDQAEPAESIDIDPKDKFTHIPKRQASQYKYTDSEEENEPPIVVKQTTRNERPKLGALDRNNLLQSWDDVPPARDHRELYSRLQRPLVDISEPPRSERPMSRPGHRARLGEGASRNRMDLAGLNDDSEW